MSDGSFKRDNFLGAIFFRLKGKSEAGCFRTEVLQMCMAARRLFPCGMAGR